MAAMPQRLCKNTNKKITTWQSRRIIAISVVLPRLFSTLIDVARALFPGNAF